MNRLNPIYVGIGLILVLFILVMNLQSSKDELIEAKDNLINTEKLANELSGLKNVYGDKKRIIRELKKILRHNSLKSANIQEKLKKSSMTISSESMNITALNQLMGKLVNSSFNITSIKIKKLSQEKASFSLEIKW